MNPTDLLSRLGIPPLALWIVVGLLGVALGLYGVRHLHRALARQPLEDNLTVIVAAIATGVSAQGMWRFSEDVLGFNGPLRILLFAFIELAVVTSAVRARRSMREKYSAGIDGVAVWVLTCLTAALSAMDARSLAEVVFRLAAPLVAAWLWERGMAVERRRITGLAGINWRLTPERILVRVGLAEARDRSASEVDAHRRLTRVARAAKRLRLLQEANEKPRKLAAASSRLDKAVDRAVEHAGLADDERRQEQLLDRISALLAAAGLARLSETAGPWQRIKHPALRAVDDTADMSQEARATIAAYEGWKQPRPLPFVMGGTPAAAAITTPVPVPAATSTAAPSDTTGTEPQAPAAAARSTAVAAADRPARPVTVTLPVAGGTGATSAMRRYWDEEIAAGHLPTGTELAKAAGCGDSYGRRMRRQWEAELDPATRQRLTPSTGTATSTAL